MENKKFFGITQVGEKDFLEAYEKYADAIFRHCYFRVYDKDLAEDLTQETFIKTWKYIAEGKEIKNIKSFLYRVATNLIIDNSRKKKSDAFDILKENSISTRLYNKQEESFLNSLEVEKIIRIIEKLDDKYKQVIIFRYIDGLSPKEIASILDESANIVSVRLNYAIKKLKEIIK